MNKLAFRKGFLMALADNGITPRDLGRFALEKQAARGIDVPLFDDLVVPNPVEGIGNIAKSLSSLYVDIPLGISLGAGGATGIGGAFLLNQLLKRPKGKDLEALKDEARSKEIQFQMELLRRKMRGK